MPGLSGHERWKDPTNGVLHQHGKIHLGHKDGEEDEDINDYDGGGCVYHGPGLGGSWEKQC